MQPVADQIFSFLMVMLLGNLVGIIFDVYRVLRRFWRPNHWGTIVGDLLFWLVVTFFVYAFLLFSIWGEVRLYVFVALALGLTVYLKLFSQYIRKMLAFLYSTLKRVIIFPLRWKNRRN